MCADLTGSFGGGLDDDSPGGRQYPMRPIGPRQYPMRPFDPRQYPMRPGTQYPMRPGTQYPMRPGTQYPMRPGTQYPMRPGTQYPMRPTEPPDDARAGYLDPEEWSADIAALFCEYSAVLRMGARLVFDVSELPFASPPLQAAPRYLPEPVLVEDAEDDAELPDGADPDAAREAVAEVAKTTVTGLHYRRLHPKSHELRVQVVARNRLVASIVDHPEVAWALKQDIASALAFRADQGFLYGGPYDQAPRGIACLNRTVPIDKDDSALKTARAMVSELRDRGARFTNPGWILHPGTLQALSVELSDQDSKNDAGQLLTYDGADGGTLLGYPYVVSAATHDKTATPKQRTFFSCDWSEAWIGAEAPLVAVDIAPNVRMETDETVIRAVTQHDISLRFPAAFVYTGGKRVKKDAEKAVEVEGEEKVAEVKADDDAGA